MADILPIAVNPDDERRNRLSRAFLLIVAVFLLIELGRLVSPYLTSLMAAGFLSAAYFPAHKYVQKRLNLSDQSAAVLSTVAVALIVLVPLALMSWLVVKEASQLGPVLGKALAAFQSGTPAEWALHLPGPLQEPFLKAAASVDPSGVDLRDSILAKAQEMSGHITEWGTGAVRNIFLLLLNLLVLVAALFHAFRDGERGVRWFLAVVPMESAHKQDVAARVYRTFEAVVVGALVTAIAQGSAATLGYWICGVRLPILLGAVTTAAALFPGASFVSVPVALYMLSVDRFWGAVLLVWSVGVVGVMDNFLRPILIGSKARLPILLLFFGMLGAIRAYGVFGLLLGPILITAVLAFVDIYRQVYYKPKRA